MTRGLLQEIKLAELIQLVGISERTGVLELTPLYPVRHRPATIPIGHIVFHEGQPYAAFLADRVGSQAAENLFLWEAGFFSFKLMEIADLPPQNIIGDVDHDMQASLIFHGLDRLARWNNARAVVPTLRATLHRLHPPKPSALIPPIDSAAHQVLHLCDGGQQLDAIARHLGLGRLRCREVAADLVTGGLVAYSERQSLGEHLVKAIVSHAMPTLGVAADLFCDDALLAMHLPPEQIGQIHQISIAQVQGIIADIERSVAETLDPMRATALAQKLCHELHVPPSTPAEVQHV